MSDKKQAMKLEADPRPINCGTGHCSCIECVIEQPWQELSSDEISQIGRDSHAVENPHILPHTFAVAISKALREKNERPTK